MAVIVGKVTEDFRKYMLRLIAKTNEASDTTNTGTAKWNFGITHFKYGEGGWIDPGSGRVRRNPVEDDIRYQSGVLIQDLDAEVDATRPLIDQRYPADSRAVFQKALTSGDITHLTDRILAITCTLDTSEFNDDGSGNDPEIWELGVFMDHPTESGEKLLAFYGTFDKQTKTSAISLSNTMKITF